MCSLFLPWIQAIHWFSNYDWPLDISQSFTFRSAPPVANNRSTGLHLTAFTSPSCASCAIKQIIRMKKFNQIKFNFKLNILIRFKYITMQKMHIIGAHCIIALLEIAVKIIQELDADYITSTFSTTTFSLVLTHFPYRLRGNQ